MWLVYVVQYLDAVVVEIKC